MPVRAVQYLYFDESIRNNGGFIVGALVVTNRDISPDILSAWQKLGLEPGDEYKSSQMKVGDAIGQRQRSILRGFLQSSALALTVCPSEDRRNLGAHCVALVEQLVAKGQISTANLRLFVDQNIRMSAEARSRLGRLGVELRLDQDSREIAGLQLADHAAHALGGMLLEELGVVRKLVKTGEHSGYDPNQEIDLGFELWAGLRYALIGKNEHIPGKSPHSDDPANPFFRVDGYGLYLPDCCTEKLVEAARNRFGVNYLGCIH